MIYMPYGRDYDICHTTESFMAASLKSRTEAPAIAQLFGELRALFSGPKAPTTRRVLAELEKSHPRLHGRVSFQELNALRETVRSLALFVDKIEPDESEGKPAIAKAVLAQAREEDEIAQRAMQKAKSYVDKAMTTPKSVREGDVLVAQACAKSNATMASRIANGEFLTSGELQGRLHIKRASISGAVKAGRMFAVVGPSGENFYPAYFADEELNRRALEKVSKSLGTLPASSKHHFFTSKSTLLEVTPLEALRKGRVNDVLTAAAAFAER
jgi:hypothetical protein